MARTPNVDIRQDFVRNNFINGGLDLWQRGTSAALSTTATFQADRVAVWADAGISGNQQRDTDTPNGKTRFSLHMDHNATNSTDKVYARYRMEADDSMLLSGEDILFHLKVKSGSARNMTLVVRSADVADDFSTVTQEDSQSLTVANDSQWQDLSVLIPGSVDASRGLEFELQFDDHSVTGSTANLRIAQIQILEGAEELPFRRAGKNIGEEIQLCQRYYEKTYNLDVEPGSVSGNGASAFIFEDTSRYSGNATFASPKRATPTLNIWDTQGSVDTVIAYNGSTQPISKVNANPSLFRFDRLDDNGGTPVTGRGYKFHWTADAEL